MLKRIFSKQNRALLAELVRTDFKLRYQGSVLGYAWSLLRPLLLFIILYVVFVKFLKIGSDIPHFPIYLLLGIVLWNFFNEMTVQSATSIVNRGDLIRKIRIPRWIIVFSSSISALINLGLNLMVVLIFAVISDVHPLNTLPLLPVVLLEAYLCALGVSLLLSALFVRFRDVSYIWEVALQAGFYLTPVLYPLSRITSTTLQKLILLNPMAQIIQDARYVAITHDSLTITKIFQGNIYTLIPLAIIAALLTVGTLYFKKEAKYFAENL